MDRFEQLAKGLAGGMRRRDALRLMGGRTGRGGARRVRPGEGQSRESPSPQQELPRRLRGHFPRRGECVRHLRDQLRGLRGLRWSNLRQFQRQLRELAELLLR